MSDLIDQHKRMAMGESIMDGKAIKSPFRKGPDHGKPAKGELKEDERGVKKPVYYDPMKMPTQGVPHHGKHK